MQPLVSIILPVYNAAEFLPDCIESILQQTYPNFELIMVDDGSKDDSPAILKRYGSKDKRIKIITQTNQGVSQARNAALQLASGSYIAFIDSDDQYHINFLETMLESNHDGKAELTITAFYTLHGKNTGATFDYMPTAPDFIGIDEYLTCLLSYHDEAYWGANWNKLYRSEIIKQNQLIFEKGVSIGEDFLFNLKYLNFVNTVAVNHLPIYGYRIDTQNSLSKLKRDSIAYWNQYKTLYREYFALYEKHGLTNKHQAEIEEFIIKAAYDAFSYSMLCKKADSFSAFQKTAEKIAIDPVCVNCKTIYSRSNGVRKMDIKLKNKNYFSLYLLFLFLRFKRKVGYLLRRLRGK